jgi:dTDP-4-amino-4,6-dideoxygalactose transaminase
MSAINLFKPHFRNEEISKHWTECLNNGWTGLGFKTVQMEEEWKKYTGLPFAHFLNSNTSGLHLAVKILKDANKWNEGDEIITSPLTFVASNHAIMYERMKPVFADVDQHLCLDPEDLVRKITKKTKAVMFIGIGGNAGQFDKIVEICKQHKLKLILDAAHMSGTFITRNGNVEHIGQDADVTVFSFQAVKNLPTSDSGMICFKNEDYDSLVRKLAWLGIDKDTYQRTNDKGTYKWEYELVDVGYKYHGNSIVASMGLIGLKYLDVDNDRRREICKMYEKAFNKAGIPTIKTSPYTTRSSRHLYQVNVPNRNDIMSYLNTQEIYPGVHYRDNTKYSVYKEQYGNCPNSHILSEQVISLPLHMSLSDEDVQRVIDKVIEGYKLYV